MKYLICFLSVLVIIECREKENPMQGTTITFSEKIQELDPGEDFEIDYIVLEFTDECMIGSITKIEIIEDRIFVLDHYHALNLFVFDLSGKYITKIGARGGAPYEFDRPMNFCINRENRWIIIDDSNKQRLMYYDLDDYSFIKSQYANFGYTEFCMFENGEIGWFNHGGISSSKEKDYFHLTDSLLNVKWTGLKAFYKSYMIDTSTQLMYDLNGKRYVYHQLSPILYEIKENNISEAYNFVFKEHSFVSIDEIKKRSKNLNEYNSFLERTEDITTYGVYDTNDFLTLVYGWQKKGYIAMYNKVNNKTSLFNAHNFASHIEEHILFSPKGTTDEILITIVYPSFNKIQNIKNETLKSIIKNLDEDHNPILGLMRLKTN